MKVFAVRLQPDQDLKQSLQEFVETHQIQAGFMLSAVGSLKQANVRFAGQDRCQRYQANFEIVSLVGTLSINGSHLHISLADQQGTVLGGHLSDGCIINTTAEIVVGASQNHRFKRVFDGQTGYLELEIN
ncbi:MAG: PPC domain-containing DNA-binding protein [Cyanophyceae cyanobacterium]